MGAKRLIIRGLPQKEQNLIMLANAMLTEEALAYSWLLMLGRLIASCSKALSWFQNSLSDTKVEELRFHEAPAQQEQLEKSIVELYGAILTFLSKAAQYYGERRAGKLPQCSMVVLN